MRVRPVFATVDEPTAKLDTFALMLLVVRLNPGWYGHCPVHSGELDSWRIDDDLRAVDRALPAGLGDRRR